MTGNGICSAGTGCITTAADGGKIGAGAGSTAKGTVELAPRWVLAHPCVITTEPTTAKCTPTIKLATTDTLIFQLLDSS
jgi:hypothetical protein